MTIKIGSVSALMNALSSSEGEKKLEITCSLLLPSSIILPRGVSLCGTPGKVGMISFKDGDGIGLSGDNELKNLFIQTSPSQRAIYLVTGREDLGQIKIEKIKVTGQVQLVMRSNSKKLKIDVNDVDVVSCDSRNRSEQPQKYGVNVFQGAFTLYNFNPDPKSEITGNLLNLTIGRSGAPVIGSGIFISGYGDEGGRVNIQSMTTYEVHSNGMLPDDTQNIITGGVFIVSGCRVKSIIHHGAITTYGRNDMVLDAWGEVDTWIAERPITSFGPSGIGFVNFGVVQTFEAKDRVETFGIGARGFNQYDGTIKHAVFRSITTHGDGSVGVQVSKPVGTIEIKEKLKTFGSNGETLFKGKIMNLPANGISIKSGGLIERLVLGDGIETNGAQVKSLEVDGVIQELESKSAIVAKGETSIGLYIGKEAECGIQGQLDVSSPTGIGAFVEKGAKFSGAKKIQINDGHGQIVNG